MDIHELVSQLIIDTKGSADASFLKVSADSSIRAFMPELLLCATIILMLLVKVFNWGRRIDAFYLALIGSVAAFYFTCPWLFLAQSSPLDASAVSRMEIFTGMLVYDGFTVFVRAFLLAFVVLFLLFTKLSGVPDRSDGADVYTLVLGGTIGMCLMASANHLLMVFMAVEMASVPSYVLAGMQRTDRRASEASLKYAVYGAGAAGVMLYGISLLCGVLNTAHLPTIAVQLAQQWSQFSPEELTVLALGGLMVMVGLAFKLSAVPFHFWCPDVFEGATAEVNAFLSIASKAAALALLVRVAIGFGAVVPEGFEPGQRAVAKSEAAAKSAQAARENAPNAPEKLYFVADVPGEMAEEEAESTAAGTLGHTAAGTLDPQTAGAALWPARDFIAKLVAFFAIITCTFGNLAAYGQTNIKRLMAYSTIAHAGYMMMPVPALMAMVGYDNASAQEAVASMCIYMAVYLFMNLGAFAIVAFLRNAMGSEEIADYAGLIRRCPITVICLALILFSLVGMPPLAGFIGKFAIFASLMDGYAVTADAGSAANYLMVLLVVGGINTAISLFYYLRVVKVMTMEPEPEDRRPLVYSEVSWQGAYVWLVTAPTALLILNWNGLSEMCLTAAKHLLS